MILERYLVAFARIVGSKWTSITYVDCFSGPWKSSSESYEDTSFAIAIRQLREARNQLAEKGTEIQLRAFFIEQKQESFAQLQQYVGEIDDLEIEVRNARLEDLIDEICGFVNSSKTETFPFIFIDPTGWTGFALDVIRPLLRLKRCEVLINFMTQHIVRFINNDASGKSFERLFGSADFREHLNATAKDDRVDAAVFRYRDVVSQAGGFNYPGVAGILNPQKNQSHFHLIYLSRHWKGLKVFKDVERSTMADMEAARAGVQQSSREAKSKQRELFAPEEAPESKYFRKLRQRYLRLAIEEIDDLIKKQAIISYDDVWKTWLQYPMVWEKDLKQWIEVQQDRIVVEGLTGRDRVPNCGKKHFLRLHDDN